MTILELPTIATFSKGLAARRHLTAVLGATVVLLKKETDARGLSAVAGWGLKDNTDRARKFAARHGLPYLSVEDGFIRSIGLGVKRAEPFGFIVDRSGMYYDATRPSDLEDLIRQSPAGIDCQRVQLLMNGLVRDEITKYNHVWNSICLPKTERPRILLIDQTRGDLSVKYGLANADSFRQMVDSAKQRYPNGKLFVKTHPDVIAGKKKGYLTSDLPGDTTVIRKDCNPFALLKQVDHVYTVTSQMGFDALIAGKNVSCFGMPFYAGWGATEDSIRCPRRNVSRSVEEIFNAAYLNYVRYVDPVSGRVCNMERVLDRIVFHKQVLEQNRGDIFCFGFQFWKRGIVSRFFGSPRARVHFLNHPDEAERKGLDEKSRIVVWGLNQHPGVMELAKREGIQVERLEDGFLRSVGLGSDFARPASLVIDSCGIYFDPRTPSALETLLNTTEFDETHLEEASRLRRSIVSMGMSKYNTGEAKPLETDAAPGQKIILVPGQVEDDASIQAGCVDIRTNFGLLHEVRKRFPQAYVIYKPHPDVHAGNRKGSVAFNHLTSMCDQIVTEHNIHDCLERVDEVHTLTSLTGFEALLREKVVCTYGIPFYAGWGLTVDRHAIARRRRLLKLDELVYGALIQYPRYYDWQARCFVSAEDVVAQMQAQLGQEDTTIKPPIHRHLFRKARYLCEDLREALGTLLVSKG